MTSRFTRRLNRIIADRRAIVHRFRAASFGSKALSAAQAELTAFDREQGLPMMSTGDFQAVITACLNA